MIKTILMGLFHAVTLIVLLVLMVLVDLISWGTAKFLALFRPKSVD